MSDDADNSGLTLIARFGRSPSASNTPYAVACPRVIVDLGSNKHRHRGA
jgi:hypothetical protein